VLDAPGQKEGRARRGLDPLARDPDAQEAFYHVERLVFPEMEVAGRTRAPLLHRLYQPAPADGILAPDVDGDARASGRRRRFYLQTRLAHGSTSTRSDGPRSKYSG
jgi:hypothetical protein